MSAQNFAFAIGAGASIRLPAGRFFMVRTATAALDITTEGNPGSPLRFIGMTAGTRFGPVEIGQGWRFLIITSASAQNVEIVISDDGLFDVANTVTVSGAVAVSEVTSSVVNGWNSADITITTGNANAFGSSPVRKRITIGSLSTNTGSVRITAAGGAANRGLELQPGMYVELRTSVGFDVRNDSGASQTIWWMEET
jgi:hypothetical protein